ncbi:MAG: Cellulose 1,4-beta-cellobiosidase-like protein, partial [Parcubacteria group bacterium GW2011_GWB1_45_9]
MKKLIFKILLALLIIIILFVSAILIFRPCPKLVPSIRIKPYTILEHPLFWYATNFCPRYKPLPVSFINKAEAQTTAFDLESLKNNFPDLAVAYDKINIFDAWKFVNKAAANISAVVIGIIDTGVDANHPEFAGVNLGILGLPAFQALEDRAEEFRSDLTAGHGTAVAGIIGANNLSATQVLPVGSPQMNGIISGVTNQYFLESRTAKLINFATFGNILDTLPPDAIVNMSFSHTDCIFLIIFCIKSEDFDDATNYYKDGFIAHPDKTFVISAGNEGIDVGGSVPANINLNNTIIVAATNLNDERAVFRFLQSSNFGVGTDLSAPGIEVYAPAIQGKGNFPTFDSEVFNYSTAFEGTSASAPMVTGVAAILKALEPEYQKYTSGLQLTPEKIKEILVASADPINTGEFDKPLGKDCFNFNSAIHTGCRLNSHRASAWFFPPKAIQELQAPTTTSNSITLEWSLPSDFDFQNPDFDSYRIFRSTSPNVTTNNTSISTITNQNQTSFTDANLTPNTTFFYKLFVFDKAGLSTGSNEVSSATISVPRVPLCPL